VLRDIRAKIKAVNVNKNGITVTFEEVEFRGTQVQEISSLVGEEVSLSIATPQMSLFELEEPDEDEVLQELGIKD